MERNMNRRDFTKSILASITGLLVPQALKAAVTPLEQENYGMTLTPSIGWDAVDKSSLPIEYTLTIIQRQSDCVIRHNYIGYNLTEKEINYIFNKTPTEILEETRWGQGNIYQLKYPKNGSRILGQLNSIIVSNV